MCASVSACTAVGGTVCGFFFAGSFVRSGAVINFFFPFFPPAAVCWEIFNQEKNFG